MSTGHLGYGASLTIGIGTSTTAVANILSVSAGPQKRSSIDISTMDSSGMFMEFIPGMIDTGEITATLNYDGTTIATLLHAQLTATATTFTLWFNDHATPASRSSIVSNGFITSLGEEVPKDGKIDQSVTIKLTGEPTYDAHA